MKSETIIAIAAAAALGWVWHAAQGQKAELDRQIAASMASAVTQPEKRP